jgi:hypothetical protein
MAAMAYQRGMAALATGSAACNSENIEMAAKISMKTSMASSGEIAKRHGWRK